MLRHGPQYRARSGSGKPTRRATLPLTSQRGQLTSQRVALYRQTNIRFRRLLPPFSFRKNPEFPALKLWAEVSVNGENEPPHER